MYLPKINSSDCLPQCLETIATHWSPPLSISPSLSVSDSHTRKQERNSEAASHPHAAVMTHTFTCTPLRMWNNKKNCIWCRWTDNVCDIIRSPIINGPSLECAEYKKKLSLFYFFFPKIEKLWSPHKARQVTVK